VRPYLRRIFDGQMKTWFLPPGVPEPKSRPGPEGLRLPEFEPAEIRLLAQRLKAAQRELLKLRNDALFRAIDEAVSEWTAPDGEARRTAEMSFRQASGLAPATAPFSTVLETCAGPNFREWAKSEVIPLAALEKFTPGFDGIPTRAVGPSLVLHVLPGNVPLVWLPSFLACLFMRSPCLLKPAREDPLSASLFCRTIADKLPVLAPALAAVSWTGGDNTLETELLREAEALIIYGGDEAVLSLATRLAPETKLAAHGPRIAVGAITRETSGPGRLEAIAGAAARDGLLYDGRGCLSLSTIYIEEGGIYSPRESARILAQALADASAVLPAGRPDPESAARPPKGARPVRKSRLGHGRVTRARLDTAL
jgi:hypothetical protein